MTRQELLNYLNAASDAENAIYACEQVIKSLDSRISSLRAINPPVPVKPKLSLPAKSTYYKSNPTDDEIEQAINDKDINGSDYAALFAAVGFIATIIYFFSGIEWESGFWAFFQNTFLFILALALACAFALLPAGLLWLLGKPIDSRHNFKLKQQLYHQRRQEAESSYSQAVTAANNRYQIEMDKFYAATGSRVTSLSKRNQLIKRLTEELDAQRTKVRSLDQLRQQLYNKNILHPNYRNMVAVNQLREYVEMGVCSTLEGPTGAYAEYLKDIRTNRIVGSIDAMHATMAQGFNTLAKAMNNVAREVRATRTSIDNMNTSLTTAIGNIHSLHAATLAEQRAYDRQMQNRLASIDKTLSTAAHNQYVTLRETNIRRYLRLP